MNLYQLYESQRIMMSPLRAGLSMTQSFFNGYGSQFKALPLARQSMAGMDLFERLTRYYDKPEFAISTVNIGGTDVEVDEEIVLAHDFYRLIRFRKSGQHPTPKMLLVAPMSGHHATLLRDAVERFLPYFDIYVTDWLDVRNVPLSAGAFDLDDYIDALIRIFQHIGDFEAVVAVCQPAVPVLAALSLMAEDEDTTQPNAMILMGGPIDTRQSPTEVNNLATSMGLNWFRNHLVQSVPPPYAGIGRRVYPGFLQLSGFMSMNLDRHVSAYQNLFDKIVEDDQEAIKKHDTFYDEYRAVMDLTEEFYLQTIDKVFIQQALPHGTFTHRDRLVKPSCITQTGLMTIEGERDDISGIGQTEAAHALCPSIPKAKRKHLLHKNVGHYGLFTGRRFNHEIAPQMIDFIMSCASKRTPTS